MKLRHLPRVVAVSIAVVLTVGPGSSTAFAAPAQAGALDPTFGTGGIASDPPGWATSIAVQPDGDIVATGEVDGMEGDLTVVRYTTSGAVDTTFGTNGIAAFDFGDPVQNGLAPALAHRPDGTIVVAGTTFANETDSAAVGVLTPDGAPDDSFGTDGMVTTPDLQVTSVLAQPDGDVVVAGFVPSKFPSLVLVRYQSDGTLDPAFGQGGIERVPRPSLTPGRIALGADGAIVAAVTETTKRPTGGAIQWLGAAKFTPEGVLDPGFGTAGVVLAPFPRTAGGVGIQIQPDGRILVVGQSPLRSRDQDPQFALARFTADGAMDTSFGSDGTVMTSFSSCDPAQATAVALQPNGKIVVVGHTGGGCGQAVGVALARYRANGRLDPTFGTAGLVTTALQSGAGAYDVDVLTSQRILVAGAGLTAGGPRFILARYLAN